MMHLKHIMTALIILLSSNVAWAENMLTLRIDDSYYNVMITVKEKLNEYGYQVANIQKCDGGMESMGYQSDEYKVVFFGKLKEVRNLSQKYPQITPYVPLKIAVIKENDSIVIVALNPSALSTYFKQDELKTQFKRWENDLRSIFKEIALKKIHTSHQTKD